jgi:probable F420-dependent oxidoreductase
VIETYLAATDRITVATSVVNVWKDHAATVAASYHRLAERFPDRFLLGVGIGHREQSAGYAKPYDAIVSYLAALDAAGVPRDRCVLAALGPRMLRLAAQRAAGAIPYLVTAEHTRQARRILGSSAFLAPEQKVVLEADPERARAIGRPPVAHPYLGLTNYLKSLRAQGYTDEDLAGEGSDRLIDDLALHGTAQQIVSRLREHLDAGADHVVVQLLTGPGADPRAGYSRLAEVLLPAS